MSGLNMLSRIQIYLNPELIEINAFQDNKTGRYTYEIRCSVEKTFQPLVSVETMRITRDDLLKEIHSFLNLIHQAISRDIIDPDSLVYKSLSIEQQSLVDESLRFEQRPVDLSMTLTPERINGIIFQLESTLPEERTVIKPSFDEDDQLDRYLDRSIRRHWRD